MINEGKPLRNNSDSFFNLLSIFISTVSIMLDETLEYVEERQVSLSKSY